MQAEDKKHPTNALASGLQQLWNRAKGRRLYVYGGITVLIAAVIVLVYILRHNAREAEAVRWRELDSANTEEKLLDIIKSERHQGKITQTLAKLDLARIHTYDRGINQLGTANSAELTKAITELETGRKYYLDAVNGLKDNPMLEQESWVSLALAEQVLSGVPKEENLSEYRGSIDTAISYYKKAAAIRPDSEPSKNYAKKAEEMTADKEAIAQFYQQLYKFGHLAPRNPHDFGTPPFQPPGEKEPKSIFPPP